MDQMIDNIIQSWSNPSETNDTLRQLLELGYLTQDFYLRKKEEKHTQVPAVTITETNHIAHLSAVFDAINEAYCNAAGDDQDELIKHVFYPLKLALHSFSAAQEDDPIVTTLNTVWDRLVGSPTSKWIKNFLSINIGPYDASYNKEHQPLRDQLTPQYRQALCQIVRKEEQLQTIDQKILLLEKTLEKKYRPTDQKHKACSHFITTYRTQRYLLLSNQYDRFQQYLGNPEDILKPLQQNRSRINCLFTCFSPSIANKVKYLLNDIRDISTQISPSDTYQATEPVTATL